MIVLSVDVSLTLILLTHMGTRQTPAAVTRLRDLTEGPDPKMIRVGIRSKGCSGKQYHLEYTNMKEKFDEEVKQDGMDITSQPYMLYCVVLLDGSGRQRP